MTRVLPFPGRARSAAGTPRPADEPQTLPPGVHVAPFVTLNGRPMLMAIGPANKLLAMLIVDEDDDEPLIRRHLDRLLVLYGDVE